MWKCHVKLICLSSRFLCNIFCRPLLSYFLDPIVSKFKKLSRCASGFNLGKQPNSGRMTNEYLRYIVNSIKQKVSIFVCPTKFAWWQLLSNLRGSGAVLLVRVALLIEQLKSKLTLQSELTLSRWFISATTVVCRWTITFSACKI